MEAKTPASIRWTMSDLAFSLSLRPTLHRRNFKLVVRRRSRPELPHLTLSWRNQSGDVDLHWTYDTRRSPDSRVHVPIASGSEIRLAAAAEPINDIVVREVTRFLPLIRPAKPAWLRRHHYSLIWADQDQSREHLLEAFPKRRGKYYPDLEALVDDDRRLAVVARSVYSPSLLKELPPDPKHGIIEAFSARRGMPHLVIGAHPRQNGELGWSAASSKQYVHLSANIMLAVADHLLPRVGAVHRAVFEEILCGLELEDLCQLREILADIRQTLRDPTSALSQMCDRTQQGLTDWPKLSANGR